MKSFFAFLAVLLASSYLLLATASAYVASSSNYRIQMDSLNTGGALSTSTSYRAEDTLGESGVGTSSSASFALKAGYQQMQATYLAITVPGNISLAPSIPSNGGGVANGTASWTITTDNVAGYSATIAASGTPALLSGANNFANYTRTVGQPDFTFSVAAAAAEFGFTPEGTDIPQRFRDDGVNCNVGSGDTASACWDALTTSATTTANRTTGNHPSGTALTLRFRAESGASNVQPAGSYQATTTITVIAN